MSTGKIYLFVFKAEVKYRLVKKVKVNFTILHPPTFNQYDYRPQPKNMEINSGIIWEISSLRELKELKMLDIMKTVQLWRNNVFHHAVPVS